jgi:hypothetical protein
MCLAGCGRPSRLAQTLDDGGVRHAAALAHRLQPVATAELAYALSSCPGRSAEGPQFAPLGGCWRVGICASQTMIPMPAPAWPNPANVQLVVPVQCLVARRSGAARMKSVKVGDG